MRSRSAVVAVGLVVLAALTGTAVLAQMGEGMEQPPFGQMPPGQMPQPGQMPGQMPMFGQMPPPPPAPVVKVGANSVYVLTGLTLTKYDAATLKQQARADLSSGREAPGAEGGPNPMMMMAMMAPRPEMLLAPATGTAAEQVLIVAGDEFIRVDGNTLKVAARGELPRPQGMGQRGQGRRGQNPQRAGQGRRGQNPRRAGQGQGPMGPGGGQGPGPMGPGMGPGPGPMGPGFGMLRGMGAPVLELNGNRLYILRADTLMSVDIRDGKLAAQAVLTPPENPQ